MFKKKIKIFFIRKSAKMEKRFKIPIKQDFYFSIFTEKSGEKMRKKWRKKEN